MNQKTQRIVWVVLLILAALWMASSGIMKFMPNAEMVDSFARWGHSETFMMMIGAFEIAGAIGLFIPKLRKWAILGLLLIMAGAIFTHITAGEYHLLGGAAMAIVLLALVFLLQKPKEEPTTKD